MSSAQSVTGAVTAPDATAGGGQRRLGLAKVFYPSFQFLTINFCTLVETGILNCCRRGDGQ